MTQYVYWHAPVWEVLFVVATGLMVVGWCLVRALRRPKLADVFSSISPALNEQPLLFFDRANGITPLNAAAERTLDTLSDEQRDILLDTLLETYTEKRISRVSDWSATDVSLIATPILERSEQVSGVLAVITRETRLPVTQRDVGEPAPTNGQPWLRLGESLQLHECRPVVRVERSVSPETNDAGGAWRTSHLKHREEAVLRHLWEHRGEVQPAGTLFRVAWPDDPVGEYGLRPEQHDRLRRLIYELRQQVEPDPRTPRYLGTAHGAGYVLHTDPV